MSEELDPTEFMQRIRQMGAERDEEDAARVRKLEEEIIQGRSERLARRAERARSLSPDKPSTPSSTTTPRAVQEQAAETPTPTMKPPTQENARNESLQALTGSPASSAQAALEDYEPKKPAPNAAAMRRSGTLSWQQRPQSGSPRRPLSRAASPDKIAARSPRDTPEPSSPADSTLSRNQIAQSLGAKNPDWFRQTPDRGLGSAALRRNQEENIADTESASGKRQLPGMSRDSTSEPEASSSRPESFRSSSPPRADSGRGSLAEPTRKLKSPLPVLDSQKFAPPSEQPSSVDGGDQAASGRALAMSPTQGRISPERTERPASPTKGMGGFVQSAMLKRSDSVNKRWSTQTPQGLTRQNSTLSNRGSVALSAYGTLSKPESRPSSLSRDNSMEPSSRPGSSSGNLTLTKDAADKETSQKPEFVKPALPYHSRSKSVASTFSETNQPQEETSPPSPSKRWSPTKSSWLESALKKPESPKPKLPPPQQPSWMAEINRAKQQRGSVDLGKDSPIHSPHANTPASGRSSPFKDVQLKPAGLRFRRPESPSKDELASIRKPEFPKTEEPTSLRRLNPPKTEEPAEPVQPSPKPKPILSHKPSIAAKEEVSKPEEPLPLEDGSGTDTPAQADPRPVSSASRFSKDSPLPSSLTKAKPDTPPKKDFRATLRSRQGPPGTSEAAKKDSVSELANVFGRLKKTETKNYVAPDLLKDNILRGKQGLALTGGPKPTVRRDEFKDSIVTKKAAMLAKAQEVGSAAHKKADSLSEPPPTPEAIAKRKMLGGRSESISNPPPTNDREGTPEAISRQKSLRLNRPVIPEKKTEPVSTFAPKEPLKSNKFADRFNPALAGLLARGPPPASAKSTSSGGASSETTKSQDEDKSGPAPELTHITKGRARGPKRRAPVSKQAVAQTDNGPQKVAPAAVPLVKAENIVPSNDVSKTDKTPEERPVKRTPARESFMAKSATPTPFVTRTLSRESFKSKPATPAKFSEEPPATRTPGRESLTAKPTTPAKSPELSRKLDKSPSPELPRKPASLEFDRKVSSEVDVPLRKPTNPEVIESPKPVSPSPRVSPNYALKEIAPPNPAVSPVNDAPSPEKSSFSVKSASALWSRQSASSPTPTKPKSPIKLPTRADEQAIIESAGLARSPETAEAVQAKPQAQKPKPKPVGLGLGSFGSFGGLVAARSRESSPPKPLSAKALPATPPASGDRRQSEPFKASPMPPKSDDVFGGFFDEYPVTTGELPENINSIQILQNPPLDLGPGGKIRTLRKQIQEITGDGKLSAVPMQEEHVLYQDSMYLCTHVFGDSKGARTTEVYLWSGNGVAEATLEDAQLFGRNAAKQNQGKLIILRQGKETPNFFEALGGIVLTRRGLRPASKKYMLCGRRHLGHIAFDEVDFSLKSLCSGFTYIIATEAGKIFLWKGRGCSAEELSGARLMGMDLTPDGELVEINEGSEPPELFNAFPPSETAVGSKGKLPPIPRSADHWRYKATADKYRARLFKIEQQQGSYGWGQGLQVSSFFPPLLRRPSWHMFSAGEKPTERPQTPSTPRSPLPPATTKVIEIMPFCQRDLEPEYIYVLDAFFDIYIIVGALSRSQSAAFSTALLFAQEYSILAVSEDDRPFMPVTTVVLEGVPRDMKSVFRFWDDNLIPAAGLMSGKLGRGKSLRIVGLEKAIQATRR
ncbi:hypothetical protein K505DRAFT_243801 [Melanomma pulvis-pyrius CBS 109.77]|uniref:Uncharacterized protein n=1 Tax=Melanomma pulvis-pyrius CBS 109.77 TaxID=1314802 RepID=A0A6A6XB70_9PLEO|nr:hypothetical protein K505DRAFT_243801 [Melanomma pulvis-pyrius CBS 109.77]